MSQTVVYYVGAEQDVAHHAKPLQSDFDVRIVTADDVERLAQPGEVCFFYNEYFERFRRSCRVVAQNNCPTIYAIDGILEWRNSWEIPGGEACPWVMRPVLSHKVACLGRSQARILESWGNLGKCEIVGVPRFDTLLNRTPRKRTSEEPFTVLIMTAKIPGYTKTEIDRVTQSLQDIKNWFESNPEIEGVKTKVLWRITHSLDEAIGVANQLRDTQGGDLATALSQVDAVITTPSTTLLESMLQGVPTAIIDYNNCPQYVSAAWSITSADHIDRTLREMIDPPERRLLLQSYCLHDALRCDSPAMPRMHQLIESMHSIAKQSIDNGEPLDFANQLLPDELQGHHAPEVRFDLEALYPDHPVFSETNLTAMRAEVGQSRREIERLEWEVGERERIIKSLRNHIDQLMSLPGVKMQNALAKFNSNWEVGGPPD